MGGRTLCLIAWTIAVGVLTGALSGSDCQCAGSTRPTQLFVNQNTNNSIDFHFLPSNTSDTSCQWIIRSTTGARLRLTAVTFKLRSDNGSCVDNLTVYDGNSSHSPILLSTCSRPSFPINSSGSDVLVSFTAGNFNSSDIGFLIDYESFWSTGCSPQVLVRVGPVRQYLEYQANGSSTYPINGHCGWLFQTRSTDYIVNIEIWTNLPTYTSAYINVYDSNGGVNLLDRLGGGPTQKQYFSSGQYLYIYSSSGFVGRGSFNLTYQEVRRSTVFPCSACGCNGLMNAAYHHKYYFKYPPDQTNYPNNTNCAWKLVSDYDYVIHVTFLQVDTEPNTGCSFDYVEVFDGLPLSSSSLGLLCQGRHELYSSGQSLLVEFQSDQSITGHGFLMSYEAVRASEVQDDIGGVCLRFLTKTVTYSTQYLVYPSNSSTYPNNVECEWRLQTTGFNSVVHITFTFVDMESSFSCSSDYVQVFDGSSSSAVSLGKVCGSTLRDFYSSGQSMFIKFHSDSSVTGSGFRLSYQAVYQWNVPTTPASVCSPNAHPETAWISSEQVLQYPANYLNYPDNADCGWLLQTSTYNYVVHVTFTFVSTESSSNCGYDYIEVLDGSSQYAVSLGRLCGSTVRDFYSSGQSVYIKFHSDGSTSGSGFRLTYQAVASWDVPKAGSVSAAVVAGAVVGSIVFFVAVVVVILSIRRHRLQQSTRNVPRNTTNNQYIAYFYPSNGSAPNVSLPPVGSCPPHVISGTPHVPPSVIVGPPLSSGPPPYHLVCQSTGASYPGTTVNGVHTPSSPLPQNSQQPMTGMPSSGGPSANQGKNDQEDPSCRL